MNTEFITTHSGCEDPKLQPAERDRALALVQKQVEKSICGLEACPGASVPLELDWIDVKVEKRMGQGSFSNIFKVKVDKLSKAEEKSRSGNGTTRSSGPKSYALKCLNVETLCCKNSLTSFVDLSIEANILSKIQHENIVRLYAVGSNSSDLHDINSFFVVLDLLTETLNDRLQRWRDEENSSLTKFFTTKRSKRHRRVDRLRSRLQNVALGIAKGMQYLHERNIVHRDLKPHNVGFDSDGIVRIFDFGLARHLGGDSDNRDDCRADSRTATGIAGTLRYMSPENCLGVTSLMGLPGDVFSYAIMLWEIITLQPPYDDIKVAAEFKEKVIRGGRRPPTRNISPSLQHILSSSWKSNPRYRLTFTDIITSLEILVTEGLLQKEESTKSKAGRRIRRIRSLSPVRGSKSKGERRTAFTSVTASSAASSASDADVDPSGILLFDQMSSKDGKHYDVKTR